MYKFKVGDKVNIKTNCSLGGQVGLVRKCCKEEGVYVVSCSPKGIEYEFGEHELELINDESVQEYRPESTFEPNVGDTVRIIHLSKMEPEKDIGEDQKSYEGKTGKLIGFDTWLHIVEFPDGTSLGFHPEHIGEPLKPGDEVINVVDYYYKNIYYESHKLNKTISDIKIGKYRDVFITGLVFEDSEYGCSFPVENFELKSNFLPKKTPFFETEEFRELLKKVKISEDGKPHIKDTPKVMGEAGAEIILPLSKDEDGKPCINALGGVKNDQGKIDYTYLLKDLPRACESITKVLMYGGKKYSRLNWDKVETERYEAALLRHCVEYLKGNTFDDETKEHSLSHLVCCAMFIIERDLRGEPY